MTVEGEPPSESSIDFQIEVDVGAGAFDELILSRNSMEKKKD